MATEDNKHHEHPSPEVMDRILGTLYGGCIGDAIGILSEFLTKEEAKEHYGPVAKKLEYSHKSLVDDDHRIRWEEGDWTDDSDQMVLIMRSLVDCDGKVDLSDFAVKLTNWVKYGYKELKDWCGLGIGTLTAKVTAYPDYLKDPEEAARAIWEHQGKQVASNGAVMRTSIVGVHNYWNMDEVVKNAIEITKTTHYDPRCQASSVAVSVAIATMLQGNHRDKKGHFKVKDVIQEAYEHASKCLETDEEKKDLLFNLECEKIKELNLDESKKIGYTYKTMGAGFWALKQSDFRKAITKVMLQGGDADTNACVGGGLLGCKLGMSALPESWVTKLLHRDWLDNEFKRYFELMKWEWNDKPKGK